VTIAINSKRKTRTRKVAMGSQKNYQKALDLAEAGRHEEALGCIQEYLSSSPNNAEALNDIGTILHCLDRSDEAIEHLVKVYSLILQKLFGICLKHILPPAKRRKQWSFLMIWKK
jgi:Flp pilus assembly protein TadD